ncbi:MAG: GTP 3',8-cyclase MoaA [Candidatus Hydrogenedentota bacterium]
MNRLPNYLRLSITDRCNLRCKYCIGTFVYLKREEILTLEELYRTSYLFSRCGIDKLRITGGEPLVRKGATELINKITESELFNDISLTTNGMLLEEKADELFKAGIRRLNISLATLDNEEYYGLTGGDLNKVLRGINLAKTTGFESIKINVVLWKGLQENEINNWIEFSQKNNLTVRFIEQMPIESGMFIQEQWPRTTAGNVLEIIRNKYIIEKIDIKGAGPASYYKLREKKVVFGIINSMDHNQCLTCNRIRVSAKGELRYCLFQDDCVDLKYILRNEKDDEKLIEMLKKIVSNKVSYKNNNPRILSQPMSYIGG